MSALRPQIRKRPDIHSITPEFVIVPDNESRFTRVTEPHEVVHAGMNASRGKSELTSAAPEEALRTAPPRPDAGCSLRPA